MEPKVKEVQSMIYGDLDALRNKTDSIFDSIQDEIYEIEKLFTRIQKDLLALQTLKNGLVTNHGQNDNIFRATIRKASRNVLMSKWTDVIEVTKNLSAQYNLLKKSFHFCRNWSKILTTPYFVQLKCCKNRFLN